jgi:acetyl esterase/lipase
MTTVGEGLLPAVPLWVGVAPGSEGWTQEETTSTDPATGTLALGNVVAPSLTPVLPPAGTANGTSVVVCPGGGFASLAWEHEGLSVAHWFAERGVAAFVLKYRLIRQPTDEAIIAELGPMPDLSDGPAIRAWFRAAIGNVPDLATADAEQALRLIRSDAERWGVDPARVGIIGFSAGGTVAVQTATTTDPLARPAFAATIYGSFLERDVPAEAPPLFAVVAADDHLCVDYVLDAAQKWLAAGVPTELHVYETGGHAFSLVPQGKPVDSWTDRLTEWLATRGLTGSSRAPRRT